VLCTRQLRIATANSGVPMKMRLFFMPGDNLSQILHYVKSVLEASQTL
jgi:hypothetical protein